jgi:hypothetical protein
MQVVVLVVVILVGVGLLQAAIWIPITRSSKRRATQFDTELRAEIEASGERIVIARQPAVYRGGTGPYSAVKGNGLILFTDRRLLFRKRSGGLVEVPVDKIAGTRRSKSFLGSRVGGAVHLVVATADPAEVGFFVTDLAAWESALAGVRSV